jgi:PST family polysaccharide transporter
MTLIKTSLLNGIAVLIRLVTLLGLNKVIALYVGPGGYAVVGQFQNAVQMLSTIAGGAINQGVTKYTAEYAGSDIRQMDVWRAACAISAVGTFLFGALTVLFSDQLSGLILKSDKFGGVFVWLGVTLSFFVFNTLLLAVLNGRKEIKIYVLSNIAGSFLALAVTVLLTVQFGLYGALVALAVHQSLTFFMTLALTYNAGWFKIKSVIGTVNKSVCINLLRFALMALVSAVSVPLSHIFVREHIGTSLSWADAGCWEAMWRLSSAYLMLVTSTLAVYFLPRLSELSSRNDIRAEIFQGYKIILPAAALIGFAIYLCRGFLIEILFSADFSGMEVLFAWQLIGDTLKIGGWILAYLMLSKAMVLPYVITEVIFSVSFYLLVRFLVDHFGLIGAAYAHGLNYLAYWCVVAFLVNSRFGVDIGGDKGNV